MQKIIFHDDNIRQRNSDHEQFLRRNLLSIRMLSVKVLTIQDCGLNCTWKRSFLFRKTGGKQTLAVYRHTMEIMENTTIQNFHRKKHSGKIENSRSFQRFQEKDLPVQ